MRKSKMITIGDGKEITVKELRIKEILSLFDDDNKDDFIGTLKVALPEYVGISYDELTELTPSEVEEIWVSFKEVNSVFFAISGKILPENLLDLVREKVGEILRGEFAELPVITGK